jgi:hypothetical protein
MRSLCYAGGGLFVDKKNVFHFEGLGVGPGGFSWSLSSIQNVIVTAHFEGFRLLAA